MSDIVVKEVKRTRKEDWPEERTSFAGLIEYEVETEEAEEPETVYVNYDFSQKYGRRRRHITVYKKKSKPLAKFVGTDRWSVSRRVMWGLRHNEGRALIRDLRDLPDDYDDYNPVRYRKHIKGKGAPYCWGIAIKENPKKLIEVGLTREAAHE